MLRQIWIALAIMLAGAVAPVVAQHAPPPDRAAVVDQMINHTQEAYAANSELVRAQPELTWDVVRDAWKGFNNPGSKQLILYMFLRSNNPHQLEVLDLAANDENRSVVFQAYDMLQNFAFHNFMTDPNNYAEWHRQNASKPLAAIVTDNAKVFLERFRNSDEITRTAPLNILMRLDFGDYSELSKLRRKLMAEGGVLQILEKQLSPAATMNPSVIYVVRNLKPDEAFVRRVIVPLLSKTSPNYVRYAAAGILADVRSKWASDMLFKMLVSEYDTQEKWVFLQAIASATDPHLIPSIIALMEADDSQETTSLLGYAVRRLTGGKGEEGHDGGWWHIWWDRNKASFPEDVRSIPYPHLAITPAKQTDGSSIRRRSELRMVNDDPQRAYWLLSPAYIAGDNAPWNARLPSFGLIVVLAGGNGNGEDLTDTWIDAIRRAVKDHYFVALPVAPRWSSTQPIAWITDRTRHTAPDARFTTESFTNEIVADVTAHYPIDRQRVYLHGVAEGGQAVYECSLAPTTPFTGFYILASTFRSSQLPSLTKAAGRHYFIQHSKEDRTAPFFYAAAAQELLTKNGASVKLSVYQGEHGYHFAANEWEQIGDAIAWLEKAH